MTDELRSRVLITAWKLLLKICIKALLALVVSIHSQLAPQIFQTQ